MKEARFTPASMHDLADVYEHIERDNAPAALKTLASLFQQADLGAGTPWIGRGGAAEIREGVRSYPVGSYVIFYRAVDDGIESV